MNYTSYISCVACVASVIHGGDSHTAVLAMPTLAQQTVEAIEQCMEKAPAPWPEDWRRQYVDTIREAMTADPNSVPGPWHLAALEQGFEPYWESLAKSQDRPSFEVQRAEIHWYVENLMRILPPGEEQRRRLHDQYEALWDHAATSLLVQFPFLDLNAVRGAKTDHLARCHLYIEAPLVPLFVHPLTEKKVEDVKKRWHDLRYDRVDFWRQLGGKAIITVETEQRAPLQTHSHYLLTQRSLDQWLTHIHAMAIVPPDHYLQGIRDRNEAERQHRQSLSRAWTAEKHLEREYHGQLLQVEYLSFVLTALLETAGSMPHISVRNLFSRFL